MAVGKRFDEDLAAVACVTNNSHHCCAVLSVGELANLTSLVADRLASTLGAEECIIYCRMSYGRT